jgi:hypothetical protein
MKSKNCARAVWYIAFLRRSNLRSVAIFSTSGMAQLFLGGGFTPGPILLRW